MPISIYEIKPRQFLNSIFLLIVTAFLPLALQAQSLGSQLQRNDDRIYLLGEVHDNPHGHNLRLELVMQLMGKNQKPVVAMEQFDRENQQALDLALTSCQDVDCVLAKVATPGWNWLFYKPYVQLALDKKITLVAANLSNTDVRKVMTQGFSSVYSPLEIAEYKLAQLPMQLLNDQRKSIQEGHCNMLPIQAIDPMVRGQIARDVWMANVVNNVKNQMVILIAGNGHVRKDAGVFRWLTRENKLITQVHGYVEQADKSDANWYDHVHVIPTIEREDPCRVFEKNRSKK
jgi:uncharacterized iron-regulated protein